MAYESLRQVFYKDNSAHRFARVAELARIRLEAESSFRTGVLGSAGEFFLAVPRELSVLNEHVLRMERKIARQREQLPPIAQWALERRLVVDEVVSTNELEGVYSTRRQINELLRADGPLQSQPHERKRFRELAQLYLSLAGTHASLPSTPEDIRALYDNIMQDEPLDEGQRPDGILFRRDQVEIVGAGGKVLHQGLHPESAIRSMLESMLALCASPDIPETYSAIL
jgi:Fic family protein